MFILNNMLTFILLHYYVSCVNYAYIYYVYSGSVSIDDLPISMLNLVIKVVHSSETVSFINWESDNSNSRMRVHPFGDC